MFFEIRSYLKDKTVKKPFIIPVQQKKTKKPSPEQVGTKAYKASAVPPKFRHI